MTSEGDVEGIGGCGARSPAGERSGSGSGSAMDAMLRQRRADENHPAEEKDAGQEAGANDIQRSGSR